MRHFFRSVCLIAISIPFNPGNTKVFSGNQPLQSESPISKPSSSDFTSSMPFSYGELTVRGRDGRRVAITDCKLEPLNLLIPGNAPIVVPKKHAWRSPSQQINIANRNDEPKMEVAQDEYEADSEDDVDDFDDETQPLIAKALPKGKTKLKARCKKDSISNEKEKEAKHRRQAERHERRAELERQEAAEEHDRLQKRIAKQEAYILRLKARYQNAGGQTSKDSRGGSSKKSSSKQQIATKKAAKVSDSDDGATTDGSAAVREMLANMKIRAGGKENPRFFAQPGEMPWSVSDDSQLIALKSDSSNTYAVIAECMQRGTGEVKRRYKYLKDCDFKVPGADETVEATTTEGEKTGMGEETTTDAEKTGEETTDVEQTGGETTDAENAEKTDDQKDETADANKAKDHEKGKSTDDWTEETDIQLWKLKDEGKTWAEIHEIMGKGKSGLKDRYKHLKSIDFKVPDETTDPAKANDNDDKKDEAAAVANDFMARASAFVEKQMEAAAASNKPSSSKSKKGSNQQPSPTPSFIGYNAFDPGTNAYIAQYSRNLLAEANAGRRRIPEPDEVFDEDDCILLALADSRRRENRWLDIQADYYNVTARMVPLEVLRWKLAGGQEPEGAFDGDEDG